MTLFPADSGSGLSLRIFLNIAPQVAIPIGCSHHICCKDCCHSEEQILGEAVGVSGGLMGVAGALNGGGVRILEWDCKKRGYFRWKEARYKPPELRVRE